MNIKFTDNNTILQTPEDFKISHIFDCGQCFRFNSEDDNSYTGVAFNKALKISQKYDEVILHGVSEKEFYDVWYNYLDLGTDYTEIKKTLGNDSIMKKAIPAGEGIRILNQELWETVVSFIISASNNIPRIKGIIERLCESFGEELEYMGKTYHTFPSPEKIASLSLEDLKIIRAGFRDKYILDAAYKFSNGDISEEKLNCLSTSEAKKLLMTIKGVGSKVADCILLFSLHRTDSFPVDVWIKRIMELCYFDEETDIKEISRFAENKFAELCGYAQQYLFFWARENKITEKEDIC